MSEPTVELVIQWVPGEQPDGDGAFTRVLAERWQSTAGGLVYLEDGQMDYVLIPWRRIFAVVRSRQPEEL